MNDPLVLGVVLALVTVVALGLGFALARLQDRLRLTSAQTLINEQRASWIEKFNRDIKI